MSFETSALRNGEPLASSFYGTREYRGHTLTRGRTFQDWSVFFPSLNRVRWGTLDEVRADVDAVVEGRGLPSVQRGGN